ncbi:hypothetical protein NPIL_199631 [Nephila pilipes]|uniref:Uncharacterized protein n=1 Tax=Nephila pilipes TaxID=299642 RepID=A0A8X6NRG0_NEPPI|nr:hypothetical protein NPIL_199631 [Nephila pilipes]
MILSEEEIGKGVGGQLEGREKRYGLTRIFQLPPLAADIESPLLPSPQEVVGPRPRGNMAAAKGRGPFWSGGGRPIIHSSSENGIKWMDAVGRVFSVEVLLVFCWFSWGTQIEDFPVERMCWGYLYAGGFIRCDFIF